jgi:hypothetical protein
LLTTYQSTSFEAAKPHTKLVLTLLLIPFVMRTSPDLSSHQTDLLSFESWEYDASTAAGLVTSSFSGEEDNLSLAGTGHTSAFNNNTSDSLLRLNVSGTTFCVEPKVFRLLERLPWKTEESVLIPAASGNDPPPDDHHHQYHDCHLSTAPQLFEIILSHVLYGSFPDVRQLRVADVEELEPLVMILELTSLHRFLQQQEPWVGTNSPHRRNTNNKHRRVPSFRLCGSSSNNNNSKDKDSNENTMSGSEDYRPKSKHIRKCSSSSTASDESSSAVRRIVKTLGLRGGGGGGENSQRRLTHAEWCASEIIN